MKPYSMDELKARGIDRHSKSLCILSSMTGITSTISSSTLIWMILRSHQGLSTTKHRLLLGLCICDIISSLSYSTFNTAAPSEMEYWVWNARGNETTCDVQGFLVTLGVLGGLYYNAALNLYFVAVVKYEKSKEFVSTKVEPFLHAMPIVVSLTYAISLLIGKHYNSGYACTSSYYYPPHCEGFDVGETRPGFNIPCGRGLQGAMTDTISRAILGCIPFIIIFISLGLIYRAVRKQEKALSKYGVGSLKLRLRQSAERNITTAVAWQDGEDNNTVPRQHHRIISSIRRYLIQRISSLLLRRNPSSTQLQSRAVMYKAFGYSFAWLFSYGVYIVNLMVQVAIFDETYPIILDYINVTFVPFQGFFNLAIYMHPKIIHAKREGGLDVSWCQVIYTAFWSRGNSGRGGKDRAHRKGRIPDLRTRTGTHHSLRNDRDNNHAATSIHYMKEYEKDGEEEKNNI